MLQILQGTDQRTLRQVILRQICDHAKNGVTGQILVVPEQDSHEAERSLCRAGGDTISRSAEVLSFTRLADRVCASCGGVSRPVLDKGGRLIAMSLALEQVGSRLKLYGTGRKKPEFLMRLLSVLEELKSARGRRGAAAAGGLPRRRSAGSQAGGAGADPGEPGHGLCCRGAGCQ